MTNYRMVMQEIPQRCELCGTIAITRPYGLNHEEICMECGEKDEAVTLIRYKQWASKDELDGWL